MSFWFNGADILLYPFNGCLLWAVLHEGLFPKSPPCTANPQEENLEWDMSQDWGISQKKEFHGYICWYLVAAGNSSSPSIKEFVETINSGLISSPQGAHGAALSTFCTSSIYPTDSQNLWRAFPSPKSTKAGPFQSEIWSLKSSKHWTGVTSPLSTTGSAPGGGINRNEPHAGDN